MRQLFPLIIPTSCSYKFATYRGVFPTSAHPGTIGTATALSLDDLDSDSSIVYKFAGYLDSKVIAYKIPDDTVNKAFFKNEMGESDPFSYGKGVLYPRLVLKRSSDFVSYKYERIPCYIIDLDKDVIKVQELTEYIVVDIFDIKETDRLSLELSDESEVMNWPQY